MIEKTMKICSECGEEKELKDFHRSRNSKDGHRNKCRICSNKVRRERTQKNKDGDFAKYNPVGIELPDELVGSDRSKAYSKIYRERNKVEIGAKKSMEATNAKIEGIAFYGGKCTCCGEDAFEFLTLEHLNGRVPGKKRRTGKLAWLEAKRAGFPDTLTVLCFNCNCASGIYGSCPHTWKDNKNHE